MNYAGYFWNRVCHDGRIATHKTYLTKANGVDLRPGTLYSEFGGTVEDEADCTHFLSCCVDKGIGQKDTPQIARIELNWAITAQQTLPASRDVTANVGGFPPVPGGGLDIPSPFASQGVYGQTWTPQLVVDLKRLGAKVVGAEFQPRDYADAQIKKLKPGDVLAYASSAQLLKYEHIALISAEGGMIACHTRRRFNVDYTDVPYPWVTLLKMP